MILPEYERNWIKIMDFLLIANYFASPLFYYSYFKYILPGSLRVVSVYMYTLLLIVLMYKAKNKRLMSLLIRIVVITGIHII